MSNLAHTSPVSVDRYQVGFQELYHIAINEAATLLQNAPPEVAVVVDRLQADSSINIIMMVAIHKDVLLVRYAKRYEPTKKIDWRRFDRT